MERMPGGSGWYGPNASIAQRARVDRTAGMGQSMAQRFRFNKDYYDRYYRASQAPDDPEGAITRLGAFVTGYLGHMGLQVRRVLDMGCGMGHWRRVIADSFPRASYTGVEYSQYLCQELGWIHGSVLDFSAPQPFDLVICQGVLQYLNARQARKAIQNLADLSRGALYLEVLTIRDWEDNCDKEETDGQVYQRAGAWYRQELSRQFVNCGGGVFLAKDSSVVMYELEGLE